MPAVYTQCRGNASNISSGNCAEVVVVCAATNATQITGSLGTSAAAGAKLAGGAAHVITSHCLEHLLGLGNDWPNWHAASYGVSEACKEPLDCVNTMDASYNFPAQFGTWAARLFLRRVPASTQRNADPGQPLLHGGFDRIP